MGGKDLPKYPDGIPKQIGNDQRIKTAFDLGGILLAFIALEKRDSRQHKEHRHGKSGDGICEKVGYLVVDK